MVANKEYLAAFLSTLSVAATGITFTWLEPLVEWMVSDSSEIPMSRAESSWLVASIEVGELAFTIPCGILADWYGRKWTLYSVGPITLIGWTLVLLTRSLYALFFVRILQGVSLAIVFAIAPMYLAEVASPTVRGLLAGNFQTMWNIGILYSYATGPYLSYNNYIFVCALPPIAFSLLFFICPETPYYLVMKGREEDAKKVLAWLRETEDIDKEFGEVKMSVEKSSSKKVNWKDLIATDNDRKALFTVQLICFVKYMIGSPAITSYAASMFAAASDGALREHTMALIVGVLLVLSAFFGSLLSDRVGRKPLIIGSTIANFLLLALAAGYFAFDGTSRYAWLMYIAVAGSCVASNLGLGTLLQTVQAELFSSKTRALGAGITGVTASVANFIDLKQYETVNEAYGLYMNFVIFSAFALIGAIIMFFVITETKGKSLGEIQLRGKKISREIIQTERKPSISVIT